MTEHTFFLLRKYLGLVLVLFVVNYSYAQEEADVLAEKDQRQAASLLSDASLQLQKKNFAVAEAQYREAIDLNQKSEVGKFNLGNAYYDKEMNETAMLRYEQAAKIAIDKESKHKAFHNLGNSYMKEKKYQEAVDAYKNALRNNPKDDESRYNLALAKDMLEKNPPPPQPDENGDDKDQDKKDNEDKKDQDKQDEGEEGDDGDKKEDKDEGEKKDDKKEGEDEKDKGKPDEPKDNKEGEDKKPQQPQPTPGKLSPQQVKSLLEAMNNEEKKVQEKMNAKKEQGAKVKTEKDW